MWANRFEANTLSVANRSSGRKIILKRINRVGTIHPNSQALVRRQKIDVIIRYFVGNLFVHETGLLDFFFTCVTVWSPVTRKALTNVTIDLISAISLYTRRAFTLVYICRKQDITNWQRHYSWYLKKLLNKCMMPPPPYSKIFCLSLTYITTDSGVTRYALTKVSINLVRTISMYTWRAFTFIYICVMHSIQFNAIQCKTQLSNVFY